MVWLGIILMLLCGCDANDYRLSSYIEDTKLLFDIDYIETKDNVNQSLYCQQMIDILENISHEDKSFLFKYGIIDEIMYNDNVSISKEEAIQMNQCVYEELYDRQYSETTFNMDDVNLIGQEVDLKSQKPGVYIQNNDLFEVTEEGIVNDYQIKTFDLQSSFSPNLSESIILPSHAQTTPVNYSSSFKDYSLEKLRSRFFKFELKGYQVSGSVSSTGLQINISKKTRNDFKIENELSLSDLKCHCDLSLENKNYYFRLDYNLKNKVKVSKTNTFSVKDKESIILEEIKERIQALKSSLPIVEEELHLLSFQFEVPSTGKMVNIIMDVSLKMFVNGEAEVVVKSSNKNGAQTFQNTIQPLSQQKFEVEPHIEGSIECAAVLNCDLKLGGIRIADIASHLGVGAEATSSIHYVDKKQKKVETAKSKATILDLQMLLDQYQLSDDSYIDMCQDVNVYYFARLQANQKQSLLRKLGLYGSYTPFKNNFKLLHIENHKEVNSCTKNDILFNPENEIELFDISNYQIYLSKGKTAQIKTTKDSCEFSSTNNDIVSVNENGEIVAKDIGYATIIVHDENGYERRCLVIVN